MFGRKAAIIKHYEGEIDRLRSRVNDLERRCDVLVDRLLAKNFVPQVQAEAIPDRPEKITEMDIFADIEEKQNADAEVTDNRHGDKFDVFA